MNSVNQVTLDALFVIVCLREKEIQTADEELEPAEQRNWLSQYRTLVRRYYKRRLRDRASLIIQLSQTPIIGGIWGVLFLNAGVGISAGKPPTIFSKMDDLLNMIQMSNGVHPSLFLMGATAFFGLVAPMWLVKLLANELFI